MVKVANQRLVYVW